MKQLRRTITVLAVAFFASATIASATTTNLTGGATISLATVIDNTLTVNIGDKNFADFFFSYIDNNGNPNDNLVKSNVVLTALMNDIGFGISFQQPLLALGADFKDIVFKYTVAVDSNFPNFFISDIHLSITGSAGNGGLGTVGENVFTNGFGGDSVGVLQATVPASSNDVAFANIVPPVKKLWVQKDVIAAGGGAANGFASISIIDQTFSQVPEPSTVLLVGLGLLGLVAMRRKHRS